MFQPIVFFMGLPPLEQAVTALEKSKSILIAIPKSVSTDALSGALALHHALTKKGKTASIVCSDFEFPDNHGFLKKETNVPVERELSQLRKFVINLDISNAEVEELSYDVQDTSLKIFITPKKGSFKENDVTTEHSEYAFDLIVVLDTPDLPHLGHIFENNSEFFYHTPIINIDHSAANENYGEINLVELTATSVSEILFELIKAIDANAFDQHISTALLAGIISKTKSFQNSNVTPKALKVASHLIDSGARREEIIRHLYQTKTIQTLKLWGRALARLKQDKTETTLWSLLTEKDFEKSGAAPADIVNVIDELVINAPNAKIVAMLYQTNEPGTRLLIHTPTSIDAFALLKEFKPRGNKHFTECALPDTDLLAAEARLMALLRIEPSV